jgi:hypothetical protein
MKVSWASAKARSARPALGARAISDVRRAREHCALRGHRIRNSGSGARALEPQRWRFYSPLLLHKVHAADQRGRASRRVSGLPPSPMRPWASGSGAVRSTDGHRPTDGAEKATDGASGSGHADRPARILALTCQFRKPTRCRRGREGPAASFACSNDCSLSRAASNGIAPPRMRPAASSASRSLRTVTVEPGALCSGRPLGRRRAPRSARMASQRSVAPGM